MASGQQEQEMHFLIEVDLQARPRLEGSVRWEGRSEPIAFSGWLELIRLVEDIVEYE